jgi:chromosome segregation ATPase
MRPIIFLILIIIITPGPLRGADEPSPVEAKLREALRATMLQLRDTQGQLATLQAEAALKDQKLADLQARFDKLTKQAAADQDAAKIKISALETRVAERDAAIAQYKEALDKWKKAQAEAAALAASTEAKRAALAAKAISLQRTVDDQQAKNRKMYEIGTEILDRYEKFGLGDALLAREPFVGITRVKFENLIQDYSDALTDTKIKP